MKIAQLQGYYENVSYSQPVSPKDQTGLIFTRVGIVSGTLSSIMVALIIYAILQMKSLDKQESAMKKALIKKHFHEKQNQAKNPGWVLVENMIESNSQSDWKLAIIEADILLEESMKNNGFPGDTLGEILTNATEKSFRTYNQAWQAHRVRNDIAHGGSSYGLTKDDAVRTINMYKMVLLEFGVI